MPTFTTNSATSLEEQRIEQAIRLMREWQSNCTCAGKFCESFGCSSLDEIISILNGESLNEH